MFAASSLSKSSAVATAGGAAGVNSNSGGYVPPALSAVSASALALKTRVVRWRPVNPKSANGDSSSRQFVCGSAGEIKNELTVRSINTSEHQQPTKQTATASAAALAAAINPSAERLSPHVIASLICDGDTNDIRFVSDSLLVTGMSTGAANLISLTDSTDTTGMSDATSAKSTKSGGSKQPSASLSLIHSWKRLHSGPVTAIDWNPATKTVATAGEDGALNFVSPESKAITHSIAAAHSSSIYCVRWNSPISVVTCGMGGRLSLFDLRVPTTAATASTGAGAGAPTTATGGSGSVPSIVCEYKNCGGLTSLAVHPSRPDTIATGSVDGVLSLWDVRNSSVPTCSLQAHSAPVWDVLFLPSLPTALLTCAEDGLLCMFDFNKSRAHPTLIQYSTAQAANSVQPIVLYRGDGLPLNRLEVDPRASHPQTILCTTDTTSLLHLQHSFLRDI